MSKNVGLLAPAVTPWKSTLAPETGANNPGLRLYSYDLESGELLDYQQFWLDLVASNENGIAEWQLEYSFKNYFEVPDLSKNSFDTIFQRMQDDPNFFEKYYKINSVSKSDDFECDSDCRKYQLCAIEEQKYDKFEECILSSGASRLHTISSLILLLILLPYFAQE